MLVYVDRVHIFSMQCMHEKTIFDGCLCTWGGMGCKQGSTYKVEMMDRSILSPDAGLLLIQRNIPGPSNVFLRAGAVPTAKNVMSLSEGVCVFCCYRYVGVTECLTC